MLGKWIQDLNLSGAELAQQVCALNILVLIILVTYVVFGQKFLTLTHQGSKFISAYFTLDKETLGKET
jgi:hypothetical protein